MITLYGSPRSRSLRVSWMLEELGLEWNYHYINFQNAEHRSEEYLSLNPCGKVPALKDGELVFNESAAICLYLAEKYGPQFLPTPGSDQSALHHRWVSFTICELEQALWSMGKHRFALPEEHRLPEMQETATWEFDKAAAIAELWVPEEGYLCGEQFTVADVLLCHTLNWAMSFQQQLPPKLMAYRKRTSQRSALNTGLEKEMNGKAMSNL
ncbi:glutathione S-transferase family protein [Agarivorans sp. 1_MG-2023]|uniref:glutathione S-transferase family protein n=1 Tax=Agarivorans sp. 1_MG-2023 TaxID=3062634 RepID=UPI0026E30416|nr:glutathione S-transferase family protein [Agarivorans sp. 1_MG-2023]MDO6762883.1 glutathione S-transferase family protein [Agarivorans sp. 1_MG-2023]